MNTDLTVLRLKVLLLSPSHCSQKSYLWVNVTGLPSVIQHTVSIPLARPPCSTSGTYSEGEKTWELLA